MAKLEGSNAPAAARRILQALDIGVGALLAAAANIENGAIATATAPLVEPVKNAKMGIDGLKTAVYTLIDQATESVDRVASILEGILDAAFINIDDILAQTPIKTIKDQLDQIGGSLTQLVDDALKPLEPAITKLDGALAAAVPTVPIPSDARDYCRGRREEGAGCYRQHSRQARGTQCGRGKRTSTRCWEQSTELPRP